MRRLALLAALMLAAPAQAELRDFCASRPGLGTPACTIDAGHAQLELGMLDWQAGRDGDVRTDTLSAGQAVLHVGLDDVTEAQIGWVAYGHVRTADRATGMIDVSASSGDVTLALRRSLSGPNGKIAVQPYVSIPTGGAAIGAGDWGAGVILPIGFDLGHGVALALTPHVDAVVNQSRLGRHLSYGTVVGLSAPVARGLTGTIEAAATRDDDPSGARTQAVASASLALMAGKNTQLDVGTVVGLNANSAELYLGVTRRF